MNIIHRLKRPLILILLLCLAGLIMANLPHKNSVNFIIPDKNTYKLGEIFTMPISVKGSGVPINIVRADFRFDPSLVEVIDISTTPSFATIFIQKEINNQLGYGRLTGGLPGSGWNETVGTFGTIYLRGKRSGLVKISYLPSSLVLAGDGKGTSLLNSFSTVYFYISNEALNNEAISAQQHEMQIKSNVLGEDNNTSPQLMFTGYGDPFPSLAPLPHNP